MSDGRNTRIFRYILGIAVVLLVLAAGTYHVFGSASLTVLDVIVSGVLAAALVLLYFQQTDILESQHDLRLQELNREARQQHTETLRERVRIWHGNPDREEREDLLEGPDLNLPAVRGVTFESAPTVSYRVAWPDESPFRVVPSQLHGDRYLEDLLENHASDLRETKEEIERLQQEFESLREEFRAHFDAGIIRDQGEYTVAPVDQFTRWMFDLLVMLERGLLEDFDELRNRARSSLERGNNGLHPDESRIWIRTDIGGGSEYAVYSAVWEGKDRDELSDEVAAIQEEVDEMFEQVLDRMEERRPYGRAVQAADTLDAGEEAIERLERLLVEYNGRPIYPGDCSYLEEAELDLN